MILYINIDINTNPYIVTYYLDMQCETSILSWCQES